jgi:hypothetical protein
MILANWLERLVDADWSEDSLYHLLDPLSAGAQEVAALLDPKDPQDVPRAIKLLNLISDLRHLDRTDMNPSELQTHNALSLLGEMLSALIEPFINPSFSLSQQIISLGKFAFILCAIFIKHETGFMPCHLYSDLQCMVRTAVFRVAHSKMLDPDTPVFLCLLGDDVLEALFGCVRMIGGHSPNFAADEFCNRSAAAVRLQSIYQSYPKWERKPRRLMLKRGRDSDHLSPRHWKGELRARSCNILECWDEGISQAIQSLGKYGCRVDFDSIFGNWRTSGVDLLRPLGGKYPGISSEIDRSLNLEDDQAELTPDLSQIEASAASAFRSFDGQSTLQAEQADARCSGSVDPVVILKSDSGKEYTVFKKTAVRVLTAPSRSSDVDYHKSHDRLIRVRTFSSSIGGHSNTWDVVQPNLRHALPESKILSIGSLFATLISTNGKGVSLCVLQCTSIKIDSRHVDSAPTDEITLLNSSYDIGGQILELIPFPSFPQANSDSADVFWLWTSAYVRLEKLTKSRSQPSTSVPSTARVANLNFVVNGRLVYPFTHGEPSQTRVESVAHLFTGFLEFYGRKLEQHAQTWQLNNRDLKRAYAELVQRAQDRDISVKILVTGVVNDGRFPYSTDGIEGECLILK